MSNLYAVTKGCYSDYYIVGLFSSKEDAEKCVSLINGETHVYDEANIEEYGDGLWEGKDKILRTLYHSRISLKDGADIDCVEEVKLDSPANRTPPYSSSGVQKLYITHVKGALGEAHAYGRSYVSKEHAHKLAVEARQQYIAKDSGC